jgi:predicted alpha-1,2-mannosidase
VVPAAVAVLAGLAVIAWVPGAASSPNGLAGDPASLVDPMIGTGSGGATVGQIDTYPGASAPFGMLSFSPDTPSRPDGGGYNYADHSITGFSLTHLSGPGCGAYGDFPILPTVGSIGGNPVGATEPFDHADEHAAPGQYQVTLAPGTSDAIHADLAATARTGIGTFTYPPAAAANMLFKIGDAQSGNEAADITVTGDDEVTGDETAGRFCGSPGTYQVHFVATFSRPFTSYGTWQAKPARPSVVTHPTGRFDWEYHEGSSGTPTITPMTTPTGASATGAGSGAWVTFAPTQQGSVTMKVAISYVSPDDAWQNLEAEDPGWSTAAVAAGTNATWNDYLGRIRIGGGTAAERAQFYTALYHALLGPNVFSDVNGDYTGFDNKVHQVPEGTTQYANYSGWDIYRDEVQLLAVVAPEQASQMMSSLLNDQAQGGWLPKWGFANDYTGVMNGDAADPILADAYAFGARDFDARAALAAMVKGATVVPTASQLGQGWYDERPGLSAYESEGYIPNTSQSSRSTVDNGASETLEYSVADFAISRLAHDLGDSSTAATFLKRSQNWTNIFNTAVGYIEPRDGSGQFPELGPTAYGWASFGQSGFQEGNAAQYTWSVPQNLGGLISAIGGDAAVIKRLDTFFQQLNAGPNAPYDWAGNEPSLGTPWIYDYAGAPSMTQRVVHELLTTVYSDSPGGEPGNDDLGAMSAWYVWASLGIYPQTPGTAVLALGAPLFSAAELDVPGRPRVTISAPGASPSSYIQGVTVNGRPSQDAWLPGAIIDGSGAPATTASVGFTLSGTPNASWGSAPAEAPPSYQAGPLTFPPGRAPVPAQSYAEQVSSTLGE